MQALKIDGFTVNSSFDSKTTDQMIRSFLAIAQASFTPGFEQMSEQQQELLAHEFFKKNIPSPVPKDENDNAFAEPFLFEMEDGETAVIHAANGEWFVLLEREMLSFKPDIK